MKTLKLANWYFPVGFYYKNIPKAKSKSIKRAKQFFNIYLGSEALLHPNLLGPERDQAYELYLEDMREHGCPPISDLEFNEYEIIVAMDLQGHKIDAGLLYRKTYKTIEVEHGFSSPLAKGMDVYDALYHALINNYSLSHEISMGTNSICSPVSEYKRRFGAQCRFVEIPYYFIKPAEYDDYPYAKWVFQHMPMFLFRHTWILRGLLGR